MKIFCIGRNYGAHAAELGNEIPPEPVIFLKPETALIPGRQPFFIPDFSSEIHYEIELVLRISRLGKHIEERFAHRYYDALTVGIDFTARDVQDELKAKGLPWEKAKAFDGSAALGQWVEIGSKSGAGTSLSREKLGALKFELKLDEKTVQQGNSSEMIFGFDRLIAEISKYFTLKQGDLIFTGTPKGVGPVRKGQMLQGFLGDERLFELKVK